ncbi:hypothetical protein, partial [Actinomadura sp. 7K507]|uniref:hypothetical protein n=1 Tax=Actinomadura sp. 7K507 TaxID=2530365 RepID=UPI001A9F0AD7
DPPDPAASTEHAAFPEQGETDSALESASTRTQEDISKYMPPEPPDTPAEGASGESSSDVVPRYGKKPHKAGRHAEP